MKHLKLLLLCFVTTLSPTIEYAQDQTQYINYFSVGGEVCLPVRVKHSRGEFTFSSNRYRVDGPIDYVEAWDCQNRKILDTTPKSGGGYSTDKSKPIIYEYVFCRLYPQSQEKEEDNYNEEELAYTQDNSDGWDKLAKGVKEGARFYDPAYPNITFQAGMSRVHGEFLRAKACLGGRTGYILYGGVGRDWIFNPKNEKYIGSDAKKLGWHAGLGFYGGDLNGVTATGEFALMVDYSETPMVSNGSINLWLEGTWYFGARGHFGAFGGLGFSLGNLKNDKPKCNFIFEIGLAYRFY